MYYYAHDYPNNVSGLLNSAGSLANTYSYGPFGLSEGVTEAVANSLRFGAREFDGETGLYYQRARYYDPGLRRFVSEDPVGLQDGVNTYTYPANDPSNKTDPTGLAWECVDVKETVETDEGPKEVERTVCTNTGGGSSLDALAAICEVCAIAVRDLTKDWSPLFHRPERFELVLRDQHGHLHVWILDGYQFTRIGFQREVKNRLTVATYYVDPMGAAVNSEGLHLWWAKVDVETGFRGPFGWERRFTQHRFARGTVRGAHFSRTPWIKFENR